MDIEEPNTDLDFSITPFNASDANAIFRWYHDPAYSHYFRGFVNGVSIEQCMNAPALLRSNILIAVNEHEKRVGLVSLADTSNILRIYRLGLIVDKTAQHTGIGKALLERGIEWAFDFMNAHKVVCEILVEDERVIEGAKRAGFIYEGTLRQSQYLNGEFKDEAVYSMLHAEFNKRKLQ
jgi:RimJ/RimL family protein N-acetyltransferase